MKRVTPLRAKPKRKSAAVRRHHDRVAMRGCCVCGAGATIHHVTGHADRKGRFSRDDWLVVPLCPTHHQKVFDPFADDPVSVEGLGHRGFYERHGIDLLALAEQLREESWTEEARAA